MATTVPTLDEKAYRGLATHEFQKSHLKKGNVEVSKKPDEILGEARAAMLEGLRKASVMSIMGSQRQSEVRMQALLTSDYNPFDDYPDPDEPADPAADDSITSPNSQQQAGAGPKSAGPEPSVKGKRARRASLVAIIDDPSVKLRHGTALGSPTGKFGFMHSAHIADVYGSRVEEAAQPGPKSLPAFDEDMTFLQHHEQSRAGEELGRLRGSLFYGKGSKAPAAAPSKASAAGVDTVDPTGHQNQQHQHHNQQQPQQQPLLQQNLAYQQQQEQQQQQQQQADAHPPARRLSQGSDDGEVSVIGSTISSVRSHRVMVPKLQIPSIPASLALPSAREGLNTPSSTASGGGLDSTKSKTFPGAGPLRGRNGLPLTPTVALARASRGPSEGPRGSAKWGAGGSPQGSTEEANLHLPTSPWDLGSPGSIGSASTSTSPNGGLSSAPITGSSNGTPGLLPAITPRGSHAAIGHGAISHGPGSFGSQRIGATSQTPRGAGMISPGRLAHMTSATALPAVSMSTPRGSSSMVAAAAAAAPSGTGSRGVFAKLRNMFTSRK